MRTGCPPLIASIWAYRSRGLRRVCPGIFLAPSSRSRSRTTSARSRTISFSRVLKRLRLRPDARRPGRILLAPIVELPRRQPQFLRHGLHRALPLHRKLHGVALVSLVVTAPGRSPGSLSIYWVHCVLWRHPNWRTPSPALFGRFLRQALWLLSSEATKHAHPLRGCPVSTKSRQSHSSKLPLGIRGTSAAITEILLPMELSIHSVNHFLPPSPNLRRQGLLVRQKTFGH